MVLTFRPLFDLSANVPALVTPPRCDENAIPRRLRTLDARSVRYEMERRHRALQCFRRADIDHPSVPEALFIAFVMLLEDDGKNVALLRSARLMPFLKKFLPVGLFEQQGGWPSSTETTALAVALFWKMSSHTSVHDESPEERQEIMDLLAPFTFAAFRYSIPPSGDQSPTLSTSFRGPFPPLEPPPRQFTYFGQTFTFHCPSPVSYAIPSYFCRQELRQQSVPAHAPTLDAPVAARVFPTRAMRSDFEFLIRRCITHFVRPCHTHCANSLGSARHDPDWKRTFRRTSSLTEADSTSFYPLGTFNGVWNGSFIAPDFETYDEWVTSPKPPPSFENFARQPLSFVLTEYRCSTSSSSPVPLDLLSPLWWDKGYKITECEDDSIDISSHSDSFSARYEPFNVAGTPVRLPHKADQSQRFVSVFLFGKTTERHGLAWGSQRFFGHVALSDGKITLLRETDDPRNPDRGRAIFEGYRACRCPYLSSGSRYSF